jgi:hypothetical protein
MPGGAACNDTTHFVLLGVIGPLDHRSTIIIAQAPNYSASPGRPRLFLVVAKKMPHRCFMAP